MDGSLPRIECHLISRSSVSLVEGAGDVTVQNGPASFLIAALNVVLSALPDGWIRRSTEVTHSGFQVDGDGDHAQIQSLALAE
jgi:hypothetical protein